LKNLFKNNILFSFWFRHRTYFRFNSSPRITWFTLEDSCFIVLLTVENVDVLIKFLKDIVPYRHKQYKTSKWNIENNTLLLILCAHFALSSSLWLLLLLCHMLCQLLHAGHALSKCLSPCCLWCCWGLGHWFCALVVHSLILCLSSLIMLIFIRSSHLKLPLLL
jgi:hypothetical protein